MIRQIALLPRTRSDRGEAFIHAGKWTALEIVPSSILEQLPSTIRVPQPLTSGAQVFERDDARSQFGNNSYSRSFADQIIDFKALDISYLASCFRASADVRRRTGAKCAFLLLTSAAMRVVAKKIHDDKPLRKSAAKAWFGSRRSTVLSSAPALV